MIARIAASEKKQVPPSSRSGPTAHGNWTLTQLADGGDWYENIWFTSDDGMFVSDCYAYKIYRLTRPNASAPVTKRLWVDGAKANFKSVLGLQPHYKVPHQMLAVVELAAPTGSGAKYGLLSFSTTEADSATLWATTAALGNGLMLSDRLRAYYSPAEVDFIPDLGKVMLINASTRASRTVAHKMTSADGAWLDDEKLRLWVSQVAIGKINVYDVSPADGSLSPVSEYAAPGAKMVDDFCVLRRNPATFEPSDAQFMFAADFWEGNVVAFRADGSGGATIVASGLTNPTSVRPGFGRGFDGGDSLFVSEGGFLGKLEKNRRVFELKYKK